MLDKWQKKEKPVFTGITRGTGGFGFGSGGGGGGAAGPGPLGASGGNIADGLKPGNGYVYHTFGTPGTFTCTNQNEIEILVVGGGGATGAFCAGGGGAGGVVHATSYVVSAGDHPITVGPGGTAVHPGPDGTPANGGDSYFGAPGPARLTGYGGGRGAKAPSGQGGTYPYEPTTTENNSAAGGSGAGGVRNGPWPGNSAPSTFYSGKAATQVNPLNQDAPGTVTNYGNPGGDGGGAAPNSLVGGGGGGAGASGGDYPSSAGGAGQPFPQFAYPLCFPSPYLPGFATPTNGITGVQGSPTSDHYAGGGGGARHLAGQGSNDGTGTAGGVGGGGRGGNGQPIREVDGVDYLGGGGGDGGGYDNIGSPGGKGVVIIRYPTANE